MLVTDSEHLMVINAGRSFWHEERTFHEDPHLRVLQIFVRPHTLDLAPKIQHGPLRAAKPNSWRYLFGPEASDAPFWVRNDVHFYDVRLDDGASATIPRMPGWDSYFFVFNGEIEVEGVRFAEAESGLLTGAGQAALAGHPAVAGGGVRDQSQCNGDL
jgi:redox-sensitive bicupin YhaK (pirin superfamily)